MVVATADREGQMTRPKPRRIEHNAGAFLGSSGRPTPVPMRTLSDEYRDEPEPEDSDREPEPEPAGLVRRIIDRLRRRSDPGH